MHKGVLEGGLSGEMARERGEQERAGKMLGVSACPAEVSHQLFLQGALEYECAASQKCHILRQGGWPSVFPSCSVIAELGSALGNNQHFRLGCSSRPGEGGNSQKKGSAVSISHSLLLEVGVTAWHKDLGHCAQQLGCAPPGLTLPLWVHGHPRFRLPEARGWGLAAQNRPAVCPRNRLRKKTL